MKEGIYKGKYRIASARLAGFDYTLPGLYFVTICTKDRICYLGSVRDGNVILSTIGQMVVKIWEEIPNHFSQVEVGSYVVMPNHVHGIISIGDPINVGDTIHHVSASNDTFGGATNVNNPMGKGALGEVIRWFKGRTTFEVKRVGHPFGWQARFHDSIVRSERSLQKIEKYIQQNPEKWFEDELFVP